MKSKLRNDIAFLFVNYEITVISGSFILNVYLCLSLQSFISWFLLTVCSKSKPTDCTHFCEN